MTEQIEAIKLQLEIVTRKDGRVFKKRLAEAHATEYHIPEPVMDWLTSLVNSDAS